MCQRLAELRQATQDYAERFDPALRSVADNRVVVAAAAAIEHMAATIKMLAAAAVADSAGPSGHARRATTDELARTTGTTAAAARESVDTGRRLAGQPDVAAAARQGRLSPAQTSAIADAAAADPDAAARLVDTATNSSLGELRQECARTKAAAQPDADQRRRHIHADRRLRSWTDQGGVWHLNAQGLPEDGAQLMAALAPRVERLFNQARRHQRPEPPDAYAFDALIELAIDDLSDDPDPDLVAPGDHDPGDHDHDPAAAGDHEADPIAAGDHDPDPVASGDHGAAARDHDPDPVASGDHGAAWESDPGEGGPADSTADREPAKPCPSCGHSGRATRRGGKRRRRGAPVKLLLRVDWDTFLRGVPIEGETCELAGYGPVSMATVHRLLANGDPFVAAILTRGKTVVGVAHLGRQRTAHQRSATEWLYPSCAVQGCPRQAHLQCDHQKEWAKTHFTMLDLLDMLCPHHHHLKTYQHWALAEGTGKRPFVPPNDPRHPRHHQPDEATR